MNRIIYGPVSSWRLGRSLGVDIVSTKGKTCSFGEIIESIRLFRGEYQGKLALQMMFVEANRSYASEMAKLAKKLSPDEVQLNTPLRPCAVNPLTPEEITAIRQEFSGLKGVVTVYEALRPEVTPLNLKETLRRRPKL